MTSTLTTRHILLTLDGSVSLSRFAMAIDAWQITIEELVREMGREAVQSIEVDELSGGSANIGATILFAAPQYGALFAGSYREFVKATSGGGTNTYVKSPKLRQAVQQFRHVATMDGGDGLVFRSEDEDVVVAPTPGSQIQDSIASYRAGSESEPLDAVGEVRGTLQSLSSRNRLTAMLYDEIFDKGVRLSLTQEMHDSLGELWDKHVVVRGSVRRSPIDGRPLSIREITEIDTVTESGLSREWIHARGVLAGVHPEWSAEEHMRRSRDG